MLPLQVIIIINLAGQDSGIITIMAEIIARNCFMFLFDD